MRKNATFKNIVKFLKINDYEFEYDAKGEYIAGDWFLFNREKKARKKIVVLRFSLDASLPEVSIFSQRFSLRFGEIETRGSYYLDNEELIFGEKAEKCWEVVQRNRPLMEDTLEVKKTPKAEKTPDSPPEKRKKWDLGRPKDTNGWTVLQRR